MQILVFLITLTSLQTVNLPHGAQTLKVVIIDPNHVQLIVLADPSQPIVARRLYMTPRPGMLSQSQKLNLVYVDSYVNQNGIGEGFFIEAEQPYVTK